MRQCWLRLAACAAALLSAPGLFAQISIEEVDAFDVDAEGWGNPANRAVQNAGVLQISGNGGTFGGKIVARNESQWTGDFITALETSGWPIRIQMDLENTGANPLLVRLGIGESAVMQGGARNAGIWYVSDPAIPLGVGENQSVVFELDDDHFVRADDDNPTLQSSSIRDVLSRVEQVQIMHSTTPSHTTGVDAVAGELEVDNISIGVGRRLFPLEGKQLVPPRGTALTGGCIVDIDRDLARATIHCAHDDSSATGIEIARGAAGSEGPTILDLGDPTSPVNAVWSGISAQDMSDLLSGQLYLSLFAGNRDSGTLRGQIEHVGFTSFLFPADADQIATASKGVMTITGLCGATLTANAAGLFVHCEHEIADASVARIHRAPAGQDGAAVFSFDSAASPFEGTVDFTELNMFGAQEVSAAVEFIRGLLYVSIETDAGPGGAIRGQIIDAPPPLIFDDGFEDGGL